MKSIRPIRLAWAVWFVLLSTACSAAPRACGPPSPVELSPDIRPVIVDTDMGPDDWMALAYLLNRPDVAVEAITVTGTGLAHCDAGVQNALGLLEMFDAPDVPVTCGRSGPVLEGHEFPAEWRSQADSFSGLSLPEHLREPASLAAADLIVETAAASGEPVELLALGPLTNVADALAASPTLAGELGGITIMGGALDVPGNLGSEADHLKNVTAEWNIFADPDAAAAVFASDADITLVPLDATDDAPVNPSFYRCLGANRSAPPATFLYDLLSTNRRFYVDSGQYFFWDPLAAAAMTNPDIVRIETRRLRVVTEEGEHHGRTEEGADGDPLNVAVEANGDLFRRDFLAVLNGLTE